MAKIVLDSSAALAHILQEPGGIAVRQALTAGDTSVVISSVNWCEVLGRMQRSSPIMDGKQMDAVLPGVEIIPFERDLAELAAGYAKANPFLSLGDRACLALASSLRASAWTADRIWATLSVDVSIKLIRNVT